MKGKIFLVGTVCFAAGIMVDRLVDNIHTQKYMKDFEDEEFEDDEDFFEDDFDEEETTTEKQQGSGMDNGTEQPKEHDGEKSEEVEKQENKEEEK